MYYYEYHGKRTSEMYQANAFAGNLSVIAVILFYCGLGAGA